MGVTFFFTEYLITEQGPALMEQTHIHNVCHAVGTS